MTSLTILNRTIMKMKKLLLVLITMILGVSCAKDIVDDNSRVPSDSYYGKGDLIILRNGCDNLNADDFKLYLQADNGDVIVRTGRHVRQDKSSHLKIANGLKAGTYRLLHLEYGDGDDKKELGLGCRVRINEDNDAEVLSHWREDICMYSSKSEVDTVYISHHDHMIALGVIVGDAIWNKKHDDSLYFLQVADLNGDMMSGKCGTHDGWQPIGASMSLPFRGVFDGNGYSINNLWITRENSIGVGLFGYSHGATIKNVTIDGASIIGNLGVGAVLGIALTGTETDRHPTIIDNCKVINSTLKNSTGNGFGIGGILGCIDVDAAAMVCDCESSGNIIESAYNAGGVVGSGFKRSSIMATNCKSSSSVTTRYSGSGGIVGTADSLFVANCSNTGKIVGGRDHVTGDKTTGGFGAGGIAGAAGSSLIVASENRGGVHGHTGVGGIIGSSQFMGSETEDGDKNISVLGNSIIRYCENYGNINGEQAVGGLCGGAQVSLFGGINHGAIKANGKYAGGIVGLSAIAEVINAVNKGSVTALDSVAGGIVGGMKMGNIASNCNMGDVTVSNQHVAGIVGVAGNQSTFNFCANYGNVKGDSDGAGVTSEAGDTSELTEIEKVQILVVAIEAFATIYSTREFAYAERMTGIPDGDTTGQKFKRILITCKSTLPSSILTAFDAMMLGWGIKTTVDHIKIEDNLTELEEEMTPYILDMKDRIKKYVEDANIQVPEGFDIKATDCFKDNMANLCKKLAISEEDLTNYIDSINAIREEHQANNLDEAITKEILHEVASSIAIACASVSTVIDIVNSVFMNPTAAAVGVGLNIFGTVLGGVNTIVQIATTPEYNAFDMTQCANFGDINIKNRGGGLVNNLQSYSIIRNSINLGSGNASGSHLVNNVGKNAEIHNSISIAPSGSWGSVIGNASKCTLSNLYYHADGDKTHSNATGLSTEQIGNPSSYNNWDIGTTNNLWTIVKGDGNAFPVPFVSECFL